MFPLFNADIIALDKGCINHCKASSRWGQCSGRSRALFGALNGASRCNMHASQHASQVLMPVRQYALVHECTLRWKTTVHTRLQ